MISEGNKSEVNCILFIGKSRDFAKAFARVVFPTPGTSSIRMCDSAKKAIKVSSRACVCPLSIRATLSAIFVKVGLRTLFRVVL